MLKKQKHKINLKKTFLSITLLISIPLLSLASQRWLVGEVFTSNS